jgi:hypothetical protein
MKPRHAESGASRRLQGAALEFFHRPAKIREFEYADLLTMGPFSFRRGHDTPFCGWEIDGFSLIEPRASLVELSSPVTAARKVKWRIVSGGVPSIWSEEDDYIAPICATEIGPAYGSHEIGRR